MRTIPAMVDMRRTKEDWEEMNGGPVPLGTDSNNEPVDFYGLGISMENPELAKLDLEDEDVEPGDMIHIHAMAVVTSVSKTDTQNGGKRCRVEMTLRHIVAEDEAEEDEEQEEQESPVKRLYR